MQIFGFTVKAMQISVKVNVERFIVRTNIFESLDMLENTDVIDRTFILNQVNKIFFINFSHGAFTDLILEFIKHPDQAAFDHDKSEKRHHK
jgi:hypothetical protein